MTTFKQALASATWLRTAAAAVSLAAPLLCGAHDLILIPEPSGNLTVRFGHPGDWQQADKERLLDLKTAAGAASAKPLAPMLVGHGLDLDAEGVAEPGKPSMITARYDNGLWVTVKDASGKEVFYNTTLAMMPKATSTRAAIKFAKGLYATADDTSVFKHEAHQLIELIPQTNPGQVKTGETLPVLVKFAGKPLANAGVEVTDSSTKTVEGQQKHMTNAAGIAQVPIANSGLNVVSVDYEKKNDGSLGPQMKKLPVDKVVMIATYAFQVR